MSNLQNYLQQNNQAQQPQPPPVQQAQSTNTTTFIPPRESLVTTLLRTIARLILFIIILAFILLIVSLVGTGLWLHTYKAFTKEKLVAVVKAERLKTDSEDNPYFKVTYTPVKNPSAFTKIFVKGDNDSNNELIDEREEYTIYGDRFMVESEVVNFDDWANLLGFETIYKITRVRGEYTDVEEEKDGKISVFDINGGIDPVWETLEYNQEKFDFIVEGVYGSSVSQSARDETVSWGVYMTEDGLIMKKY